MSNVAFVFGHTTPLWRIYSRLYDWDNIWCVTEQWYHISRSIPLQQKSVRTPILSWTNTWDSWPNPKAHTAYAPQMVRHTGEEIHFKKAFSGIQTQNDVLPSEIKTHPIFLLELTSTTSFMHYYSKSISLKSWDSFIQYEFHSYTTRM